MKLIKDLLESVITYQDIIDEQDSWLTKNNRLKMEECVDEAKKHFPTLIGKYDFEPKKDIQEEFDNLQKFINDFHRIK